MHCRTEGDSELGRPRHLGAIDLIFARRRHEIDVLIPNKCKYAKKHEVRLNLTVCSA